MIGRRRVDPAAEADGVAADLERLGALVGAGASQPAAWRYLAASAAEPARGVATAVADAAARGDPVAAAFVGAPEAWRRCGAVVALAVECGAPLGPAFLAAADSARAAAALHRAVGTSVAGPAASARVVLLLPPLTAVLGWAFGFDVPGVLLSGAGALLLVAGTALLAGAAVWSRRWIRDAGRMSWTTGLRLELVAIGVAAGTSADGARDAAAEVLAAVGLEAEGDDALDAVLAFAAEAGLPLVALLRAEVLRLRRAAFAEARVRAEVLAVRLLLPLGLLVLPAFLLLGAVPVGLAVLSSTALPL